MAERVAVRTQALPALIRDRRTEILALAEKHGATNVRVFGSAARGEMEPASDVDFLVTWDYARMSAWGGVGLTEELAALLGRRVDVVSEKALHWSIRDAVLAEAVAV